MESTPKPSDLSRPTLFFLLAAAFLVALAISSAVVEAYLTGSKVALPPSSPRIFDPSHGLLWIVVDGLPERVAFKNGNMPTLDRLRQRGAWGVSMAGPVTMTTSCVRTLGTGYDPPLLEDINAFNPAPVREDNLFAPLCVSLPCVFSGDASWTQLFGQWASQTCPCPDRGITDTFESDEKADQFIQPYVQTPGIKVVHFVGSDHVSHRTGTECKEYLDKVKEIDARIARLVARARTDDYVLVIADHGATPWGSHGGGEDEARRAPFVLLGQGVRPCGPVETDHRAWASTLGFLLGGGLPRRAERGVAWEFVEAPATVRRQWDDRFLEVRRDTLRKMGASAEQVSRASSPGELDALRDGVTGPQPGEVAWGIAASVIVVLTLSALARAPGAAGTSSGLVLLAMLMIVTAGLQFYTGMWRTCVAVGAVGGAFLATNLRDVRRSWPLRVGLPWVLGVPLCFAAVWCVCERWTLIGWYRRAGNLWAGAAVLGLCAPVAVFRTRLWKWLGEGGLGLCAVAVGAAIPAVWCYWFSHRAIYSVTAASLLVLWVICVGIATWRSRAPRMWGDLPASLWEGILKWWRPLLPLAALFYWAKQAADGDAVPRFPATTETALLGVALVLPILLRCLRASRWGLLLVAGFLAAGAVQRFTGNDRIVDGMLLLALPAAVLSCLLTKDPATRRRFLLLWGLALFRVLAKDHQYVTIALYAWLIDELADSATLSPTPTMVLVGGMAVLDLLQFHLLGSVYTFSTIDVTTGFVGTAKGLDLPRCAALVGLRYAVPLLIVALLPPPAQRNRALALFAVCFLSRSLFLLVCFPWKHVDYWWMCSAPPGVFFTAFQIGLWGLLALPLSFLTRRGS